MAAGVIGEIKPGAGPVAAMPRRAALSSTTGPASADEAYAATLRQPRTSPIAQVVRTVATGRQPSPVRPAGQTVAISAVKLVALRRFGQASDGGRSPCRRETTRCPGSLQAMETNEFPGRPRRELGAGTRAAMLSCLIPDWDSTRGPGTGSCRCRCPGSKI